MKTIISGIFLVFVFSVNAQVAPTAFTIVDQVPAKLDLSVNGYGATNYPVTNNYTVRFGRQSATVDGTNKKVSTFVASGLTYKPVPRPAVSPFDNIILKRKVNPNVSDLGKMTAFFQSVAPATNPVPNGTQLYYPPEHVGTMEGLINSAIANRGTDNLFANAGGATLNNIERVDMILTNGISATDIVKTGFLLMERGGNDPYKVAAIMSLTPTGQVDSLGALISAPVAAWGTTGVSITTTVFQKNTGDANLRPDQNISAQAIFGSYISFQALGIPAKTTIYGLVLFPNDVTTAMDLVGLTDVPLTTDASSGQGGLDFTAGGGFFIEQNTSLAFSLSGNIYNDVNGLTNSLIDGTGINNPGGTQLYAYLVGTDNLVKAKVPVNADGSFEFVNELVGNTDYTVVISTINVAVGDPKPSSAALPSGWVATGDGFGTSNVSGSGIQSGIPDLQIPVKAVDASITNVKFGIEQLPTAGSGINSALNPGGTSNYTVPANTFTNTTLSSDIAPGIVSSIRITSFPSNTTTITINGVTYTSATFPATGVIVPADANGNPTQPILVDPINGITTVVINFVAIDNAGKESLNIGTATINFSNNPPVAVNDSYTVAEDGTVTLTPLALDSDVDGDVLTITSINGTILTPGTAQSIPVTNGTVNISAAGVITFTPAANFTGEVTFPYVINDGNGGTATANEIITVTPVDDAPVAVNDNATTTEDTPVSGSANTNDTPSGDGGNTWSLVGADGGAAHGTVTMGSNGIYTYTPAAGYFGTDVFTYQVCDVDGDCSTATVTITIIPNCRINMTAVISKVTCPGLSNGSINVTVSGANGAVTYLWSDGATSEDRTGLAAGSYTLTVTDATPANCKVTATYVVGTIPDVTKPLITCPTNKVLALGANCTVSLPDYRSLATVSDNCTATNSLVVSQLPAAGSVLTGSGSTTVTLTVTDASGNSASCSFTVTRADQTAPVITCMPNKTIACDGVLTYDAPTATDNCGPTTITVVSTTSVDIGNGIVYTRTWKATDAAGNTATCSQTVTHYRCNTDIFHTVATCNDFKNGGNGHQLSQLCYATRSNKISNVTPGQFFYYTTITATSASFCVDVVQTKTVSSFGFFTIQNNTQIYLWDANCVKAATGTQVSVGQGRICITNAIPGVKYVLSVKYDSKSVIGSSFTGTAPTATYTFQSKINGALVAGSLTSINLVPNCTVPSTARTTAVVPAENELIPELQVSLSPNPASVNFRLNVTATDNQAILVRVVDIYGKVVKEIKTTPNETISFGDDLIQGMYLIEVIQGRKKKVIKALKI